MVIKHLARRISNNYTIYQEKLLLVVSCGKNILAHLQLKVVIQKTQAISGRNAREAPLIQKILAISGWPWESIIWSTISSATYCFRKEIKAANAPDEELFLRLLEMKNSHYKHRFLNFSFCLVARPFFF